MHDSELPVIETPRLNLTVPEPVHAPAMLQYAEENHEHLAPWEPVRDSRYYTLEYWETELATAAIEYKADRSLRLILLERNSKDGAIIGLCNYRNFVRGVFQACHLGYSVDYRRQGHGIMYEALDHANRYVFDQLNMHRIMANYIPANVRSGRLLARLGFVEEGLAKEYLCIAGTWQDHVLTSKVNPAWQPRVFW